jgi:DNA polymerase
MEKLQILHELAVEIKTCPKCRLADTRTHAVPGEGAHNARIMFVGEGPGENEDHTGRPFIGQAGQLLTRLLNSAGIAREDVFITNIVKCRPPGNRVPQADEVEACSDYLMAQIAVIEPKFVVPLGGSSLQTLLGRDLKISTARCKVFRKSGILYIPLFHPAAALHRSQLMDTLKADILTLKELVGREIREDEITNLRSVFQFETESQGARESRSTAEFRGAGEKPDATKTAKPDDGSLSLF